MYYKLTEGSIPKNLILFALPMIAGNLLQQIYNITDTLIVGQFIGVHALGAVGSAYALMVFLTSIFIGLSMGIGSLFSIYYGAKNDHALKTAIVHAFFLVIGVALTLTVLSYLLIHPILTFLNVPTVIVPDLKTYLM
ncbi:MATE family efflux transporter [Sharpea azabuensis]|nr:MATE family efflux transporter [Sharpea azabuensis]